MRFTESKLAGAFLIDLEPRRDHRGFFARSWCSEEFAVRGLSTRVVQCNIGYNERRGTIRGLHHQESPHEEAKVVRCQRGAIFDVFIDLRPGSPTYGRWDSVRLTAENHRMVYIPEGFGHGYQTLTDGTEIFYQTSESYHPESAAGFRFDDPALGISWPLPVTTLSDTDLSWPPFRDPKLLPSAAVGRRS